jgi:acetolactate synthase-1/2/3 large subunit
MGKGAVDRRLEPLLGTAALSERDYVHEASPRRPDHRIGHDTIEKPPFLMRAGGPKVIHVGFQSATVEQVYFPDAEVIGDIASRDGARRPAGRQAAGADADAGAAPEHPGQINACADEDRFDDAAAVVHDVRKVMPDDGIVCLDNGMYKIWFARNYRTHVANTLLLDNALATMGAGLPSAMMAAMLHPERRVMAVCGDGGFMMNSQEMETAVRLGLNLVVLIRRRRLRHDPLEAGGRPFPISA